MTSGWSHSRNTLYIPWSLLTDALRFFGGPIVLETRPLIVARSLEPILAPVKVIPPELSAGNAGEATGRVGSVGDLPHALTRVVTNVLASTSRRRRPFDNLICMNDPG